MNRGPLPHKSLVKNRNNWFSRYIASEKTNSGYIIARPMCPFVVVSPLMYPVLHRAPPLIHSKLTLERVVHAAARLFVDLRPRDHVSQALQELHWLPVNKTIDYKLCLLVHKASIGQTPTYIADMLTPVSSVQSLSTQRSATNGDYIVPRTHRKLGERAFSVAAPKAWNQLSTNLKTSTCSTDSFKRSQNIFISVSLRL